ncbi:Hypothetical_protein [Hexamita inflata]|uniref:Hypothetical_protein n=1 Tax=Hexamita inflata TaxID=28002 RepID=A0AA86Q3L4_9EUKA|nr:Hypothetical protein HINF_LOCUS32604 [Hexamita inflata]
MANMPSTSLQDWKAATAPLLPQKRRWYDAGGFPYNRLTNSRVTPWMLVPESLVALLRRCAQLYSVSKTNDHSRELTVPVQKTELVQTKVKQWDIYQQYSGKTVCAVSRK